MKEKHFIGVDMGATKLRAGLVKDGELLDVEVDLISSSDSADRIIKEIIACIKSIITPYTEGIGIGVPSVVDIKKGIVYDVVNIPSWREVHLKEILETEFSIPVYIDNDVNCFTVGEKYYGEGIGFENIIGVTLGTGIGSGIISNGKLYHGSNCGAGEIGMLPYKDSILEHYASSQFFESRYDNKGKKIFESAQKGDASALKAYEEFGIHVGNALKIIMFTYDPEVIILGGGVSRSYRFFERSMYNAVSDFEYSQSVENIKIKVSNTEHAAILGAAKIVMQTVKQALNTNYN